MLMTKNIFNDGSRHWLLVKFAITLVAMVSSVLNYLSKIARKNTIPSPFVTLMPTTKMPLKKFHPKHFVYNTTFIVCVSWHYSKYGANPLALKDIVVMYAAWFH